MEKSVSDCLHSMEYRTNERPLLMPKMHWTRRYVLREPHCEDAVAQTLEGLDWDFEGRVESSSEEKPYTVIWRSKEGVQCLYVEDDLSELSCVLFGCQRDYNPMTELIEPIVGALNAWGLDELVEEIDSSEDPNDFAEAVIRAGLGSPQEFDQRLFDRISTALSHDDDAVREAAAWATSYMPWPEYRPILNRAMSTEGDPEIRATIGTILESMDELGIGDW